MDWIDLAEGSGRWRALVNTVMNFPFLKLLETSGVEQILLAA
jgi:hypothetical protein